jgi:predicted nucleic acid-binding protein
VQPSRPGLGRKRAARGLQSEPCDRRRDSAWHRASSRSRFQAELERWLKDGVRLWFGARILEIDEEILLIWRRLVHDGQKVGYTYAQPDALIAATAKAHDLGVATWNVGDFRNAGVPVFDPWTNRSSET